MRGVTCPGWGEQSSPGVVCRDSGSSKGEERTLDSALPQQTRKIPFGFLEKGWARGEEAGACSCTPAITLISACSTATAGWPHSSSGQGWVLCTLNSTAPQCWHSLMVNTNIPVLLCSHIINTNWRVWSKRHREFRMYGQQMYFSKTGNKFYFPFLIFAESNIDFTQPPELQDSGFTRWDS